ncbi:bifunctional metallophosphatase/5'-nucleotidase [Flexivirga alba]|uniref:Bifunctional metallophosphatase/5'-nucleotidase n=1 Tax=Flexivirga alba TaxID=702742 RepID=A0ABW2AJG1_9MICO
MTTLEILHWNDVHGRYERLARASAMARRIRAEADHPVLLFDGGDIEDSSVRVSAFSYGAAGWAVLRAADVDAAVVGNGGMLRYGPGRLVDYAEAFGRPPLLGNFQVDGGLPAGVAATQIIDSGDVRVGIIGISVPLMDSYSTFGLTERPLYTMVTDAAAQLRRDGVEVVIVLSHCGLPQDTALASTLDGRVDLIVGGHTHNELPEGTRAFNGLPIAQAGNYAEHLGRILLDISEDGVAVRSMTLEPVAEDGPADRRVLDAVVHQESKIDQWLAAPVASLPEAADYNPADGGAVGRLLATAIHESQPADVTLLYPANLDDGLPAGKVTRGDIWAATSSPANVSVITVTGRRLRSMLQVGLSAENAQRTPRLFRGRMLGRLVIVGATIADGEILIAGQPLDDEATYRVSGGDVEVSSYGGLMPDNSPDMEIFVPQIMPELLEAYLVAT